MDGDVAENSMKLLLTCEEPWNCIACDGTGEMPVVGGVCPFSDGLGTGRLHPTTSDVCAVGDPSSSESQEWNVWKRMGVTMDSASTVDVMPEGELCEVDTVPCTGVRAGRKLFAANATKINVAGEKRFHAFTDDGIPLDCAFIAGAVKKALKSTAVTCDEGEQGQWVIHTKTGGWIVNCKTRQKIPFKRSGNTYYLDAWVRVPKKRKPPSSNRMEVDQVSGKVSGFTRPSKP